MRDPEIADAVRRLLPPLAPAAVLLTDGPDDAVRLLAAALGGSRALGDADGARRALARQVLGRPRWGAEQVIGTTAPDDDDVVLAEALRALPARSRAAVVLHLVAGLPQDARAAEGVSRLEDDLARRDRDDRRERERAAAPYRAPGSASAPERPAPPLPERLVRLAEGRPLPPAAVEAVAGAVRDARGRRRRRRLGAGAVAVVAGLLLALIPLLPRGAEAPPTVYGGATRGALAGDGDFVAAMAAAPWPGSRGAADSRRVVFAGDVAGGRWALVAADGSPFRPAAIAWFTGPSGASPDRMTLSSVRTAPDPSLPVSLTDPATGALVVVGAPGDRIAVSPRPEIAADGLVIRRFRDVEASRGVAVVGLPPVPGVTGSAAGLQVTRDHRRLDVRPPAVLARPAASDADVPVVELRPSTRSALGDAAVQTRLRSVLGQLGEPAAATPVTALWSGDLPGPDQGPTRLSVLAVERPSGAVVVTAPYAFAAEPGGPPVSSWCATGVLPAGVPLEQRVVAVRCDFRDLTLRAEISRFLVVVGPRTATEVRLLDDGGTVLSAHPLADGVAVVRSPGDVAAVSVTTADGGTAEAAPIVDADLGGR